MRVGLVAWALTLAGCTRCVNFASIPIPSVDDVDVTIVDTDGSVKTFSVLKACQNIAHVCGTSEKRCRQNPPEDIVCAAEAKTKAEACVCMGPGSACSLP